MSALYKVQRLQQKSLRKRTENQEFTSQQKYILIRFSVMWTFNLIILETLWECYFRTFSEREKGPDKHLLKF